MLPSPFTLFDSAAVQTLNDSFWNYNNSKFSYPELSHRSPHYANINQFSMDLVAEYFKMPKNYQVIYLTAEAGLAAIPHNLTIPTEGRAVYIVNDADS
jgi:phosphoserine aminotransferase